MFNKTIKENSWIIILFDIFLFSFLLDMYVLTRYNLSYGRDGSFYDLQVLNIFKTGFPASNDPPLVYYILAPFVMLSGNSFLGIKIGMSVIGSFMAFPAFLLTQMFSEKINIESKIPALKCIHDNSKHILLSNDWRFHAKFSRCIIPASFTVFCG